MRGNGLFKVLENNQAALAPHKHFGEWASRQGLMCWKCQKNKPRQGGSEKMMGGLTTGIRRFICQDCVEAKERSMKREE